MGTASVLMRRRVGAIRQRGTYLSDFVQGKRQFAALRL